MYGLTSPPLPDWNAIARLIVSLVILAAALYLLVVQPTDQRDAVALSLVAVVAGFWLHVLPNGGSVNR